MNADKTKLVANPKCLGRTGPDFRTGIAIGRAQAHYVLDGLLRRDDNGFVVTELGRLFMLNIAMLFDANLPKETERRYSRTV